MKKIIHLLLILFSASGFSQSKGDTYRNEGNLTKAIEAYKTDHNRDPSNARNTYNLACAYALTYQKDSAFHYLDIALKNDNSLWALADNDLISLTDDTKWKAIEDRQLSKPRDRKIQNPEYAKKLLRLIMKDQALDYQMDMAKRFYMKNGAAPHWYYPIAQMKKEISTGNFSNMEKLISQYGWPTYSSVGKLAADGPLLVINHHENEAVRIRYLARIKNACLQNEGSCMEYAKIQDRILVNTGKPQIFGMQFHYDKERKLVPFPIENPEYIDQRRSKIGLEPIQQYLKRKINYDWTIVQKR